MKCDLHVHTVDSGMCTVPVLTRVCKESYSEPIAPYETLKRRGMDLVTVTDHAAIDAVEALRHHRDFFLSEFPSGHSRTAFAVAVSDWIVLPGDHACAGSSGGQPGDIACDRRDAC